MSAAVLALAASVSWGSADFVGGLKSRQLGFLPVVVTSQVIQCALVVTVALALGVEVGGGAFLAYALLSAVAQTIAMLAYFHALSVGPMGIVAPISALAALVPLPVGLAIGESPTRIQLLGVAFAAIGLVLASYQPGMRQGKRAEMGVGLALVAALGIGIFYLLIDAASDRGDAVAAVALNKVATIALLICASFLYRNKRFSSPGPRDDAEIGVSAVLALGATILFAEATTEGLVSLVAVLGALYPITTIILARVFLKERVRATQRLGATVALAGAALVAA